MTRGAHRVTSTLLIPLTAVVVTFGACSSSATPKESARADATTACRELLDLSAQIINGQSITTAAAVQTLGSATMAAKNAAQLDPSWAVLAGTIKDIQTYLETGRRQGLGGTLDDLAVYCKPLVRPS
jgi:hypothetical protein